MKRIFLATVSLAAVAALTLPAAAHGSRGMGGKGHPGMMKEQLTNLDADGDGTVSEAEVKAHRDTMFAAMDANSDGKLTQDEMTAHHEAMRAEMETKSVDRMFETFDANKDGLISRDEVVAGKEAKRAEMQARRAEREDARGEKADFKGKHFSRMDKDGDGSISKDEFEGQPMMMFERFDEDGDGLVVIEDIQVKRGKGEGRRFKWREAPPPPPESE